jgi:hypothetical protein
MEIEPRYEKRRELDVRGDPWAVSVRKGPNCFPRSRHQAAKLLKSGRPVSRVRVGKGRVGDRPRTDFYFRLETRWLMLWAVAAKRRDPAIGESDVEHPRRSQSVRPSRLTEVDLSLLENVSLIRCIGASVSSAARDC